MLEWSHLTAVSELDRIDQESQTEAVIILKHSTRCSISAMALGRIQRNYQETAAKFYYLDLIRYREISNAIADRYQVHHESPQILLIRNGECLYEASHMDIDFPELNEEIIRTSPTPHN